METGSDVARISLIRGRNVETLGAYGVRDRGKMLRYADSLVGLT